MPTSGHRVREGRIEILGGFGWEERGREVGSLTLATRGCRAAEPIADRRSAFAWGTQSLNWLCRTKTRGRDRCSISELLVNGGS